jgi:hypothetical protein
MLRTSGAAFLQAVMGDGLWAREPVRTFAA